MIENPSENEMKLLSFFIPVTLKSPRWWIQDIPQNKGRQPLFGSYITHIIIFSFYLGLDTYILQYMQVSRTFHYHSGTCLIRHTKALGKCVWLYRMLEFFILINKYFGTINFCWLSQDVWKTQVPHCTSSSVFKKTKLILKYNVFSFTVKPIIQKNYLIKLLMDILSLTHLSGMIYHTQLQILSPVC